MTVHGGESRRIDLQQPRDEADRVALQKPSPEARHTNRALVEAERALAMATGR
jgi:hypothetical protein